MNPNQRVTEPNCLNTEIASQKPAPGARLPWGNPTLRKYSLVDHTRGTGSPNVDGTVTTS